MRYFILLLVVACLVSGCVSTTPAFGGKVHITDGMKVSESPDGTRTIERTWQGDMPAGALAEGKTNFFYDRDENGAMQIDTGGEGAGDTSRQAQMLEQRSRDEVQMFLAGAAFGESLAGKALEYLGLKLPYDAEDEARDDANEMDLRRMIDQRVGRAQTDFTEQILPRLDERMNRMESVIEQLLRDRQSQPPTPGN